LSSHKGLNLPGVKVNLPALTPKDEADLDFMIENEFEYAGLSFVQSAGDIRRMRDYIGGRGSGIRIVAKIEKPAALDDLEGILAETDGVMVARGDLGVELSVECVPSAQKKILRSAAEANVLSITATQMLESMTRNPVPTRAEAGDVANAVFDGTDALMLSGETAVGKYPVETVAMAASIATEAEKSTEAWSAEHLRNHKAGADFADSICHAAAVTAEDLGASAIVVGTQTGETALLMSKFRPSVRVVGISADEKNVRRMAAMYGVYPMHMPRMDNLEESVSLAAEHLVSSGVAAEGDIIVLTFGAPLQGRGMTNMLRLARIGDRYGVDE
ncbi:MAG: pyruvate kinase, partial [Gemmatimonadota bacterium]|nr:pyruvate kinase [Gemmatimonadota bacterium]